jgi:CheY-like chemotaxis protein
VTGDLGSFGQTARSLARNPLGIIALFLVLVYGLAVVVVINGNALRSSELLPLIYFLVTYPVLVLAVFAWLVSRHSGKLFAPSDFKDEDNYVKMQLLAVASLAVASAKETDQQGTTDVAQLVQTVQSASSSRATRFSSHSNQVLWVDDRPENNLYERKAFEAVGISFSLALSTNEALRRVQTDRFAAVISDMGRKEGPREGFVLLDALRAMGNQIPFFFYTSSNAPEQTAETARHGGQGSTNNAQDLFEMVTQVVTRSR